MFIATALFTALAIFLGARLAAAPAPEAVRVRVPQNPPRR